MPKRKATGRLSGQAGSDGANAMQVNGNDAGQRENERPAKRARGRPRSKSVESKPPAETKRNSTVAQAQAPDSGPKKASKRGRPRVAETRRTAQLKKVRRGKVATRKSRMRLESKNPRVWRRPTTSWTMLPLLLRQIKRQNRPNLQLHGDARKSVLESRCRQMASLNIHRGLRDMYSRRQSPRIN